MPKLKPGQTMTDEQKAERLAKRNSNYQKKIDDYRAGITPLDRNSFDAKSFEEQLKLIKNLNKKPKKESKAGELASIIDEGLQLIKKKGKYLEEKELQVVLKKLEDFVERAKFFADSYQERKKAELEKEKQIKIQEKQAELARIQRELDELKK